MLGSLVEVTDTADFGASFKSLRLRNQSSSRTLLLASVEERELLEVDGVSAGSAACAAASGRPPGSRARTPRSEGVRARNERGVVVEAEIASAFVVVESKL